MFPPGGVKVINKSTRDPGYKKPATPMISFDRIATARMPSGIFPARPIPAPYPEILLQDGLSCRHGIEQRMPDDSVGFGKRAARQCIAIPVQICHILWRQGDANRQVSGGNHNLYRLTLLKVETHSPIKKKRNAASKNGRNQESGNQSLQTRKSPPHEYSGALSAATAP